MGGKGGHMLHPYEDPELTFQSLINMFEHTAMGGLEGTIKRDGQNLVLSYSLLRDEAVAIRNDDHSVLFVIRAEVTCGYAVLIGSGEETDAVHAGAEIGSLLTCGTVGAD